MSTHTKEPWTIVRDYSLKIATEDEEDNKDGFVALLCEKRNDETRDANAARIISCVNALAGIENPQEALRMAREALREAAFHCFTIQDCSRVRGLAEDALAALGDQPAEWP